jgi:transcriptional regulator of acetoin/glycerol metabolism
MTLPSAIIPSAVLPGPAPAVPVSESDLEEIERATILRVFEQVNGDKTLAGKILGISRATLYRKLKRYGIGESRTVSASAH